MKDVSLITFKDSKFFVDDVIIDINELDNSEFGETWKDNEVFDTEPLTAPYAVEDNIIEELTNRQAVCNVYTVSNFPHHFEEDAYLISNGPGDPAVMSEAIELIKRIVKTGKPVFGICLGHQLLALSQGCKTYKMQIGHRGTNHAVLNLATGQAEVTSQNHGFAVSKEGLPSNIEITHLNLNDDTIEGLRIKDTKCFSVQHHPEACAGPHDSNYLFDNFINLISKNQ